MANFSASDLAGLRIRQARQRRGWTAKELAERCAKVGAPQITATVITNLETRRRASRQVAVDELLALAHVLEVPPLQLLLPLGEGEALEAVPGTGIGALEAARWIGGTALPLGAQEIRSPHPEDTARMLRASDSGGILTLLRQADYLLHLIAADDRALAGDPERLLAGRRLPLLADRLMHVAARLDALGYELPEAGRVQKVLGRRGLPSTLAEWREYAGAAGDGYDAGGDA